MSTVMKNADHLLGLVSCTEMNISYWNWRWSWKKIVRLFEQASLVWQQGNSPRSLSSYRVLSSTVKCEISINITRYFIRGLIGEYTLHHNYYNSFLGSDKSIARTQTPELL